MSYVTYAIVPEEDSDQWRAIVASANRQIEDYHMLLKYAESCGDIQTVNGNQLLAGLTDSVLK